MTTARVINNWAILMKAGPKTFGQLVPTLSFTEGDKEFNYAIATLDPATMSVLVKDGLTFNLGQGGNMAGLLSYECRVPLKLVPKEEFIQRYNLARWELIKFLVEQEECSDEEIIRIMRLRSNDMLAEAAGVRQRLKANQRKARKPRVM
jgi:hypothetical protein